MSVTRKPNGTMKWEPDDSKKGWDGKERRSGGPEDDRREMVRGMIEHGLKDYVREEDMPCGKGKECLQLINMRMNVEKNSKWQMRLSVATMALVTGLLVTFFIYLSDLKVQNQTIISLQKQLDSVDNLLEFNTRDFNKRITENTTRLNSSSFGPQHKQ